MIRLWREPLVHFLLGGAALFLLYGLVAEAPMGRRDRIVVESERVASLAATFERTWLRPPTPAELEGVVRDYIDEEILYREALLLGLDRDDLVVRRRLRQKMEFLHLDLVESRSPTDDELAGFLTENTDRFREPERLDFRQLFSDPAKADGDPWPGATQLLANVQAGVLEGDPTLLPPRMRSAGAREVAAAFGEGFARDLFALSGDRWQGPVASSFGLHIVRIEGRTPSRLPPLTEIRAEVERELLAERRVEANRQFLETLRARYEVEVRTMPKSPSLTPARSER